MQSVIGEAVKRGELKEDTPVEEISLFINAELYVLMVAWCLSDAEVIGSEKTDTLCETVIKTVIEPYRV